jgi:hypothetical protein
VPKNRNLSVYFSLCNEHSSFCPLLAPPAVPLCHVETREFLHPRAHQLQNKTFQINGIIMIIMSENCKRLFDSNEMLPINTLAPRHAIYITIDFVSTVTNGLGFMIVISSLIGFMGATYLYKYPVLNFSVIVVLSVC